MDAWRLSRVAAVGDTDVVDRGSAVGEQVGRRPRAADIVVTGDDVERDAPNKRSTAFVRGHVAVPVGHPHVPVIAVGAGDVHVVTGVEREVGRRQGGLSGRERPATLNIVLMIRASKLATSGGFVPGMFG